ncbi:hypothetical protein [Dokdonella sp.]|uniref:hypothetical protein n=1 Tax=Dokdonella sp. TaxID=2291710 RepID=UPI003C538C59
MTAPVDPAVIEGIARDSGAFLQQLDTIQRRALFIRLNEADLRAASFLDERLGLQGREGFWVALETLKAVAAAMPTPSPAPHYIFHIGHCGSTLISRLLDKYPGVLGLREPLALRELAAAHRELESPLSRVSGEEWSALFAASISVLGRIFAPGQRALIKATSNCNNLINSVLEHDPATRVVLLHMPLESYLATMMKGQGGGLDALQSAPARLQFLHHLIGEESPRLHELEPAEMVAMGWISELARFHQAQAADAGKGRVMLLDFEQWLTHPDQLLESVRMHLGLGAGNADGVPVMQWPEMRAYAKSPAHAYSPADRVHDLDLSRRKFANEIATGMRFAERLATSHPQLKSIFQ